MKDTFTKMIDHPIATCFIIGTTTSGIASIVNAVLGKGTPSSPKVEIQIGKPKNKNV